MGRKNKCMRGGVHVGWLVGNSGVDWVGLVAWCLIACLVGLVVVHVQKKRKENRVVEKKYIYKERARFKAHERKKKVKKTTTQQTP